jgi:hypothetical protein
MYGMILSRHWRTSVGGNVQFDLSYATIPIFGGDTQCLYREAKMTYIFNNPMNPSNFFIEFDEIGNFLIG